MTNDGDDNVNALSGCRLRGATNMTDPNDPIQCFVNEHASVRLLCGDGNGEKSYARKYE